MSSDENAGMDLAIVGALRAMVGAEVLRQMLQGAARELSTRLGADGALPDRKEVAFDAHALASALGGLGFVALARQCRAVEEACAAGVDYAGPVAQLQELRRMALRWIDRRGAA